MAPEYTCEVALQYALKLHANTGSSDEDVLATAVKFKDFLMGAAQPDRLVLE